MGDPRKAIEGGLKIEEDFQEGRGLLRAMVARGTRKFLGEVQASPVRRQSVRSKPAHLIVIHHIKENNFFWTYPQNKAPPQIQSGFVEKSPLPPPESKAGMPMWTVHQIWKRNEGA